VLLTVATSLRGCVRWLRLHNAGLLHVGTRVLGINTHMEGMFGVCG
jgi:hypothetical protein